MKVKNITDVKRFFEIVDSCKGKVELITLEGDRLNLKSKLSQYFSLAEIFSDGVISELEIIAYDHDDMHMLIDFLIEG
ncbi:MAG: polya polymerase [Vallitaleaceae bacterium]|nr:polya polymerase [Vallitaleaceae bacterium]